jgi:phage protein D
VANVFDWEAGDFVSGPRENRIDLLRVFGFGTSVSVAMGYGDVAGLPALISGTITEVSTSFNEGGAPSLKISGVDRLFPLTIGANTDHWERKRDSEVVTIVVGPTGLNLDIAQTDPVKPRIDQSQQTDMVFLEELAKRNGCTFYVVDNDFYFGPRRNQQKETIELGWGAGLLSFSPEAAIGRQITAVEVHGRSAERGTSIVGRARRGQESGREGARQSGGERLGRAVARRLSQAVGEGEGPVLRVRAAVHTQQEADSRARAIFEERAETFVTGSGESIGLPELLPDTNIALSRMGAVFSKTYYVSETNHKVDGRGYRTRFKVEETNL